MIVQSRSLILSPPAGEAVNAPLIGSHNIVAAANVAATSAEADHPVTELANPATDLYWQATSIATQYLTVTTGTAVDLDYFGLAGHNLGSARIPLSVEGDAGDGFEELIDARILPDDRPVLLRWTRGPFSAVRLKLQPGTAAASIAVLQLGLALAVPRRIYVGHTPLNYAGEIDVVHSQSQNGKYLGSIDLGRTSRGEISLRNLDPAWIRASLNPVLDPRRPFFFAWRPSTYPLEVAYCWPSGNPKPVNQRSNGMMQISIAVEGEA